MSKAIGMIEFKTTATGITATDAMVKTSEVEIVEAQTVCPGKYIAIVTGDLSAVKAAVDAAVTRYEDKCIDSFVLGNPHEAIFPVSTRQINAAHTSNLSAKGSMNFPKFVTRLYFLAILPSAKSVRHAITKIAVAI